MRDPLTSGSASALGTGHDAEPITVIGKLPGGGRCFGNRAAAVGAAPAGVVADAKRVLRRSLSSTLTQVLDLETEAQLRAFDTPDFARGAEQTLRSFREATAKDISSIRRLTVPQRRAAEAICRLLGPELPGGLEALAEDAANGRNGNNFFDLPCFANRLAFGVVVGNDLTLTEQHRHGLADIAFGKGQHAPRTAAV